MALTQPYEIRDALPVGWPREEFLRDYGAAIDEATRSFDLAGVYATLEQWRARVR